jgi:hypothetical protein
VNIDMSCAADLARRFPSTLPVFIYNCTNMDSTEPQEEQLVQRAAPPTKVKGLAKRPPSRPVSQLLPSPVEKTPTSATSSHRTSPQAGSPASPLPSGNAAAAASTTAAATTASGPKMQPQQYDEARQRIFDDVQGNDESQQDVRGGKPSFSEKAVKADTRRILGDDEAEDYRRPAKQVRPKYPYPQQQQQVYPDHASGYGGNYGGDGQWYGGGAEGGPYNTQGYEPYPDSGYPQQQGHHHMYSQHHHHHHHQQHSSTRTSTTIATTSTTLLAAAAPTITTAAAMVAVTPATLKHTAAVAILQRGLQTTTPVGRHVTLTNVAAAAGTMAGNGIPPASLSSTTSTITITTVLTAPRPTVTAARDQRIRMTLARAQATIRSITPRHHTAAAAAACTPAADQEVTTTVRHITMAALNTATAATSS